MKKCSIKIIFFTILIFTACLLISCSNILSFIGLAPKSKVSFSLGSKSLAKSGNTIASSTVARSTPDEIEEIFWLDISKEKAKIKHQPLTAGKNTLELDKDGIHLIGFTGRMPDPTKSANASRDITASIQTVGNLQIVSVGLDSMPISQDAEDQIDLGALYAGTPGALSSSIDAQTASANLGYTSATLDSFGIFDGSLTKFLNPDVNQNGIFDSDPQDDLVWKLTSLRYHTFTKDEIGEDGDPLVQISDLVSRERFNLVFWLNKNFPHMGNSEVSLVLPPGVEYIRRYPAGETLTEIQPYNEGPLASDGYAQYYFDLTERIMSPTPPFDGDYQLNIGSNTYFFRGVNFLKPTIDSYDGFIIPSTVVETDEKGSIQRISWYWKAVENGIWRDATPEEVRLKARIFYYYFGSETYRPDQLGKTWYENGSVDVSRFNMTTESENGRLDCDYWNRAGDDYKFTFMIK